MASSLLCVTACDQGTIQNDTTPAPDTEETTSPSAVTNDALENLAITYAAALESKLVRIALKAEMEQRYTGAPEALYRKIMDRSVSSAKPERASLTLQELLAKVYASAQKRQSETSITTKEAPRKMEQDVARVSRLHVAMSRHLDSWNAEEQTPWVTCTRRESTTTAT